MAEKIIGLENQVMKSIGFLNFMVRIVFVSTFIFTAFVGYAAWHFQWEQLMIVLTENWFRIMVGELVVMGLIQIVKEAFQGIVRIAEMKVQAKIAKEERGYDDEY